MKRRRSSTIVLAMVLALGCGGGSGDDGDDGDDGPGVDAGNADANPGGWQPLIEGDWSLGPGAEGYYCVYATVPRDLTIKAFRPLIPNGTHHTVLTEYSSASPADGVYPCSATTQGQSLIFGSGVGSPDYAFPTGVGLRLTAGSRLLLNLHLYNATDGVLTGRSGTLIQEAVAAEIEHEADMVLAGPLQLDIPIGTSTQQGNCTLSSVTSERIQLFAISQHMHRLGRHMRSVIHRGGEQIVLQDIDFAFEDQQFTAVEPFIELRPGDTLTTHCTYENTTGSPVGWGESSDDEMCFTSLFYYPAQNTPYVCPL